ncbi:hypothetical protein Smp_168700 [Schistosoma mansoni]|uniref:hypothetical protein n=1 Tax=Schistosoma mansoni TaxID=6183 RepID=UPI0001A61FB1|nr:hypothetical protein Smp_168700 [Schistosoma mansoni]|eukprot:XP_018653071.1 hypothetical protein Smp_168700 [Schistosoma mansoni]
MTGILFSSSQEDTPADDGMSYLLTRTPRNLPNHRTFQTHVVSIEFVVYKDRKALIGAFKTRVHKYSREVGNLDYISRFSSNIRHLKGQDNQTSDALSPLEVNIIQQSTVNFEASTGNQKED